jgi:hypothetical protein
LWKTFTSVLILIIYEVYVVGTVDKVLAGVVVWSCGNGLCCEPGSREGGVVMKT